ncbi:MAG TPA: MBL fold metallo-hydrolase [Gemmatales bacterium]|nr:MBL fold metallo-hydrolase [Gemmatales bacterium]
MENKFSDISSRPSVTIWGAAQQITGSMHLVRTSHSNILLDCGLILEKGSQLRNREFPFDPEDIDCVLLSHAHLDHCGNLPRLIKSGFQGPIYCTEATKDLLLPMLYDSCQVQESETRYYNRYHSSSKEKNIDNLYDYFDVDETLKRAVTLRYNQPATIAHEVEVQFQDAGHVLGSASIHMKFNSNGNKRSLTFTGDVGRSDIPLLCPVTPILKSDLIISESTYGGRFHESYEEMLNRLVHYISITMDRGGKVLIPAFSLGRVQLLVNTIIELIETGRLEKTPVYVDSPLANKVLAIMLQHQHILHPSVQKRLKTSRPFLHAEYVRYIESSEESKDIMYDSSPAVIIASSGMGEGGRIIHHLKQNIDDPRATVILVSFQTPGSLGARLLEPGPTIQISRRDYNKWADVIALRGFSGHADHGEMINLLHPHVETGSRVALVHGDLPSMLALKNTLDDIQPNSTVISEKGCTLVI